jgi:hypothetical protein
LRATSTDYATNFIRLDGDNATKVKLTCNAFRHANTYVPNAARPYLAINNTVAIVHDDATNLYGSATEAPSWYASTVPTMVTGGVVKTATYT